jgi:hypothetical protein
MNVHRAGASNWYVVGNVRVNTGLADGVPAPVIVNRPLCESLLVTAAQVLVDQPLVSIEPQFAAKKVPLEEREPKRILDSSGF